MQDVEYRRLAEPNPFHTSLAMILVGLALAIITGLLMEFMAGEFLIHPFFVIARWVAALLGAVVGWGRRLP